MTLPSSVCGETTETVGLFQCDTPRLAKWMTSGLGRDWSDRSVRWQSLAALCRYLAPSPRLERRALIPWQGWTAVLTDGPLGTDVGMQPSLAAREIDCVGIRATAVDPSSGRYEAVILEVYDPTAPDDVLRCRRTIAAANDGGRWTFDQFGEPLEFEQVDAYGRRRIRDRFTPAMLNDYLRALGVPVDADLDLDSVVMVEKR